MKNLITIFAFILVGGFSYAETIGIDMTLSYKQNSNSSYILKTSIIDEENEEAVPGISIRYSVSIDGVPFELGAVNTNGHGISEFIGNISELRDKGHRYVFTAIFEGNDQFDANEVEIEIADAVLTLKTEVIDSVNTVYVSLTGWNEEGEATPIADADIYFYVPRMYSLLPVTEAYTNEEGEDEIEFPNDIPGGPAGELKVIGRLEEYEEFGTIETYSETNWGVPVNQNDDNMPRALTSTNAPLWMVITFIILMTGVWGDYLWIVYNLFRIKGLQEKDAPINYAE